MGGSAVLGANLVDELLGDIDELRGDLNADFGTRQFRVYRVKRRWSGSEVGDGAPVTLLDAEVTPAPEFLLPELLAALHYELPAFGKLEEGVAMLREVSLTYTHDELTGGALAGNEEFYFRVVDSKGQGIPTRYYVPAAPPTADRTRTLGWLVQLRLRETPAG